MRVGLRFQVVQFGLLLFDAQLLRSLPELYMIVYVPYDSEKEKRFNAVFHPVADSILRGRKCLKTCIHMKADADALPQVSTQGVQKEKNNYPQQ